MMKKILFILFVFYANLFANSSELEEFQALLEESTEIATKNRLNVDYVPGNVTVITGEQLKKLGYLSMSYAFLNMFAGVDHPKRNMRGTGGIYGGYKVKHLLNSVEIDNHLFGNFWYPTISVDQIERVEVIKGPGSSIYGGHAVNGVINVITKKDPRNISIGMVKLNKGNHKKHYSFGGSTKVNDGRLTYLLNHIDNEGFDITVEKDSLHGTNLEPFSYAPGSPEMDYKGSSIVLTYEDSKNTLHLDYEESDGGESYGQFNILPPNDGKSNQFFKNFRVDYSRSYNTENYGDIRVFIGHHIYEEELYDLSYLPVIPGYYPNGVKMDGIFSVSDTYGKVEWHKKYKQHNFLGGAEYRYIEPEDALFRSNIDLSTGEILGYKKQFSGDANYMKEGVDRTVKSLFFQDVFTSDYGYSFTIGARMDDYEDIEEKEISPRAALVYSIDKKNIVKAQYAQAFRPPNFYEKYEQLEGTANKELKSEHSETYELSYIYKTSLLRVSNTVFRTNYKDIISFQEYSLEGPKENIAKAEVTGLESELKYKLKDLELNANISIYETKDKQSNKEFINTPHILGNIYGTYKINGHFDYTLWYSHTGSRKRVENDTRGDFPAKNYINTSILYRYSNIEYTLFIQDLFDEGYELASNETKYPDDVFFTGRMVGVQFSYNY